MTDSSSRRAGGRAISTGGIKVVQQSQGSAGPFVRVRAANSQVLAHSETYSDGHEAAQGATALERAVIQHAHRSGGALYDVLLEMDAQDAKWGDQSHHPDGTGPRTYPLNGLLSAGYQPALVSRARVLAEQATDATARRADAGELTWWDIALEEVLEAAAEEPNSPELQRELIQAAAVLVQWAAAIDRRGGGR